MTTTLRPHYLTETEVAERLRVSLSTLRRWRQLRDRGPAWAHIGSLVRYPAAELERWAAEQPRYGERASTRACGGDSS